MRTTTRFRFVAVLALVFAVAGLIGFTAPSDAAKTYACPDVSCDAFSSCSGPNIIGPCRDGNGDLAYMVCGSLGVECRAS